MKPISKILPLLLFVALFNFTHAQKYDVKDKAEMKAKMEQLKVQYVTEKASLTEAEKKAFIPLYQSYISDFSKNYDDKKDKPDFETLSDAEVEKHLDKKMADKEARLNLEKGYYAKFKAILPIKKVAKVYQAEREFKKEMWEKYQEKK